MSNQVLGDKDVNTAMAEQQQQQQQQEAPAKDVKSMEYHRQVFQSKMAEEKCAPSPRPPRPVRFPVLTSARRSQKYVSPSDNIMSPCTAKINALRNKHAAKSVAPVSASPCWSIPRVGAGG